MYWVRAFQEDGTAAWSSPIWVAILPEHPAARGFLYWQPDESARLEVDVVRRNWRASGTAAHPPQRGSGRGDAHGADAGDPRGRFRPYHRSRASRIAATLPRRGTACRRGRVRPSRQPALSGNLSRWPRHTAPRPANAPHSPGRPSPMNTDTAYRLYWGDLHRQSNVSDGEGDLAEHFRVARNEAGLDFYAMTDHAVLTADPCDRAFMEPLKGPASITDARTPDELGDVVALHRVPDAAWRKLQDLVRRFYAPGHFVTLLGYEWSCARYGDRSVYYLADEQPIRVPRTLPELYRMLEGVDAMLTPSPHRIRPRAARRQLECPQPDPGAERRGGLAARLLGRAAGCLLPPEQHRYGIERPRRQRAGRARPGLPSGPRGRQRRSSAARSVRPDRRRTHQR